MPVVGVAPAKPAPDTWPATRRTDVVEDLGGTLVADPYRWLEDETSPEVQAWMKAQDDYARDALRGLPGRDALAARFRELYYVDAMSAPMLRGDRLFYLRTRAGSEKAVLYWRTGAEGAERVLLDPNRWDAGGSVSLGDWSPSWDGRKVAFMQRPNAADEATLHVADVDTGAVSAVDAIPGAKYASPDWTPDGAGFYYEWLPTDSTIPADERPGYTEIRYHALGTDPAGDPLVHPRTGDPSAFLGAWMGPDGRYLFVEVARGWTANAVYMRDLAAGGDFHLVADSPRARFSVTAWKDQLYIWTNEGAPLGRVFRTAADKLDRKHWVEIVGEDPDHILEEMNVVGGRLALTYLVDATSELRIATLDGKPVRTVPLAAVGTVSALSGLADRDDAYFQLSSFTLPRQVYRMEVASGRASPWGKVDFPIDPSPYVVEQTRFTSRDGTIVPMFLIHRADAPRDGANPTLLYGYGGFGVSLTPSFRPSIYPWLEAGGIYAVANVRGGGEYGQAWHDAGRGANKQKVFDDFVAAGEHLVRQGWTRPDKLAINGGSNGGLLVGAAMTQRPDLWGAVVCSVPLLDMVRYHRFGSGRTWIPEYGTAEEPDQLAFLRAYSPYHRVTEGTAYPALLMMSADHDDRVDPMHARKFVAAIQHATRPSATGAVRAALLRIERNAGHGGADQVSQAIDASADMYAFLKAELGMSPGGAAAPR
ncbi:MAG: prolyl oligopeptidase family serine peptidase [Pseudomonadota bacterium]|nr:prolyl oligopeptidase family serine peptidase [Pseudomonadota bacterium]